MDPAQRHPAKRKLVDAWRIASSPWRAIQLTRARRAGTVPVGILFYHRVADRPMNPWTISSAGFEKQVNWLTDHFEIVSLDEAQRRIQGGSNTTPTVAITFDDGYADNCTFAIPLLIGRRIPFTYFVTTRHVVTGEPFEHDVRIGCPLPPNSLDTLKAMSHAGVEIGGHSRNHPDLGKLVEPDRLMDEVIHATRELGAMIGQPIRYFAFPFGQLENLNPRVFALARQHGFAGVCSAYGGWNEIGGDGFHLQRFHGDPEFACMRNWLTLDPRKRHVWQTPIVEKMLRSSETVTEVSAASPFPDSQPPVPASSILDGMATGDEMKS